MSAPSMFYRITSLFLVLVLAFTLVPVWPVQAAMLETGAVLESEETREARQKLQDFLQREEVAKALEKQGIAPDEAEARVKALSDSEVQAAAARLPELPAGQGAGTIVGAALFIFVVLIITDILGYTDVFTFVKKEQIR
ncbi:MAG: PA2779 family protein [Desulfohalobiaceae bacterium]